MTGRHSVYTIYEGHEIMFHVSTLLPYSKDNRQQVSKHHPSSYCLPRVDSINSSYLQYVFKWQLSALISYSKMISLFHLRCRNMFRTYNNFHKISNNKSPTTLRLVAFFTYRITQTFSSFLMRSFGNRKFVTKLKVNRNSAWFPEANNIIKKFFYLLSNLQNIPLVVERLYWVLYIDFGYSSG